MDRKWKMALNDGGIPYLLFDLENDPIEANNLVSDSSTKKTVTELHFRIQGHLASTQIQLK